MADHDIASTLRQTMPATPGARTPVKLDGPPQDASQTLHDGHIQPLRCAIRCPSSPRHRDRDGTDGQDLGWRIDSPIPRSCRRVMRDRSRPDDEHQSETNKGAHRRPSCLATLRTPSGHTHLLSSGRAKTNSVFPRRAFRSQGAPSPANPAVQPPQPTQTAMYCRPSRL